MNLKLSTIEITDLQARAATDPNTISEYCEAWKEGDKFPPIVVFHDGKNYFLADGFHRFFGAKKAGLLDINADVRKGSRKDALWFAAGANRSHGLKRSNSDKRHAVELALREKPELADNAISKHVGVSFHLVKEIRGQVRVLEGESSKSSEKRTGVDGKQYPAPPTKKPFLSVPEKKNTAPAISIPIKSTPSEKSVYIPVKAAPPVPQKPNEPELILDKTGWPISQRLIPIWNRAGEIQEGLTLFSAWKSKLKRAQADKDLLYAEINFSSALAHLEQFWTDLKTALPFAVCPTCQGKTGCTLCKGRGFISEFKWNTVVPAETKAIRKKAQSK